MHIELENITFKHRKSPLPVFEHLSHQLTGPGFHALFGPSGVGKTTLAHIIADEAAGFSGQVVKNGIDRVLYTYNLERLPNWSSISHIFDDITPEARRAYLFEIINTFGLQPIMSSRFSQLSLGQQNRANLTRYLVQDFDMLIMDESLANVDEFTKEQIILKIKRRFPDKMFLYISHNVAEVAKFCRDIIVLKRPEQTPRMTTVQGFDYSSGNNPEQPELDRIMLEIMNAF